MRKLVFILSLFVFLAVSAQQHLQFMGIPINGSIENFQNRLQQKGFKYDPVSKNAPAGVRGFTGMFSGYQVHLAVDYIPSSKNVYSVRVYMDCSSYNIAMTRKEDFAKAISEKYPYHISEPSNDGSKSFLVFQPKGDVPKKGDSVLGIISVNISNATYEESAVCSVVLIYSDITNSMKHEELKYNDL